MNASSHYLLIDGLNGGSASAAYPGAFEIASYVLDIELALAGGGGGGGAAGVPQFGPLIVNLDIGSGLAVLAETIATGQVIPSIRLVGVTPDGAALYDLKLENVRITRYADTSAGQDRLAFSYREIELTTTPVKDDGSLGSPETFSWDIATNAPGNGVPDPVPAPANLPPIAIDDAISVDEDVLVLGPVIGNLITGEGDASADSDPDGDALTIIEVNGDVGLVDSAMDLGRGLSLTVNADGSYSLSAADPVAVNALVSGESISGSIVYTLSDGTLTALSR